MPRVRRGAGRPHDPDRLVVRFLIDAQLPPALARMLDALGHIAEHVGDVGLGEAPDRDLWRYALEHGAVIVTKDEDFPDIALLGSPSPAIVWLRVGNTRRRALLDWFAPRIGDIVAAIDAGNALVELR